MTEKEFKRQNPHLKHLKGIELWDAMEDYLLRVQSGASILRQIQPFYKRYKFRYLFYRSYVSALQPVKKYKSNRVTSCCNKGMDGRGWISIGALNFCPHCKCPFMIIKNTSLHHRLFKAFNYVTTFLLDRSHILRKPGESRYGIGGDESVYVEKYVFTPSSGEISIVHKQRKWWQYILIERT